MKNEGYSITRERLKEIIVEEIDMVLSEATIDHASIKEIVAGASKLLGAVEKFRTSATPTMMSSVAPHIDKLEKVLEDMVSSPGSYVIVPKKVRQRVTLKPAGTDAKTVG